MEKPLEKDTNTDHDNPGKHMDPHDHVIDWSKGFPDPGPPINYSDGAPEFKKFGGVREMSAIIGPNSPEENRFKSISDFKWLCIAAAKSCLVGKVRLSVSVPKSKKRRAFHYNY